MISEPNSPAVANGGWLLTVIVPVFNEEDCLREFYSRVTEVLEKSVGRFEYIFINDGSKDRSASILKELSEKDPRVKVLDFARNFGHQIAVKAGLDHAYGDAAVIIDADLQDPPEAILEMVKKWQEGYEVVYAVRQSREGETIFKKWTAAFFYRTLKKISQLDLPVDTGDFRLVARPVVEVLRQIHERKPYLRGLVTWVGFRQTGIPIERAARFAGTTKYPLKKMMQLAWSGVTHFSFVPLQIATWVGLFTALLCLAWITQALYVRCVLQVAIPGWTSLMVAILFLGAVQLLTLGILGSYVGRTYDEARARPLYILREKKGL